MGSPGFWGPLNPVNHYLSRFRAPKIYFPDLVSFADFGFYWRPDWSPLSEPGNATSQRIPWWDSRQVYHTSPRGTPSNHTTQDFFDVFLQSYHTGPWKWRQGSQVRPNSFLATPTIEIPAVHPPNRAVGITQNPDQKFAMQWQAASEGSDGSWHVLFAPILSGPKSGLSPMPAWRNRLSAHFCQNPDFPILLGFLGALFDVIFSLFEIAHFGQSFGSQIIWVGALKPGCLWLCSILGATNSFCGLDTLSGKHSIRKNNFPNGQKKAGALWRAGAWRAGALCLGGNVWYGWRKTSRKTWSVGIEGSKTEMCDMVEGRHQGKPEVLGLRESQFGQKKSKRGQFDPYILRI